ncbi:polysaccharide deacetylase family protein [Clostridium sp. CX1]|uniref:polysaccharide deacetylase family protein n=1 Tax=Clostridium sp. CX1 TaxID=2978346 RepID=UPI0021BF0600|nr:polysaccharide deacetylase family protein [Clostridium sp. CX1]MCT8978705.1 polysaccharide deacetylase family protein [Clostridium sp. CX1]
MGKRHVVITAVTLLIISSSGIFIYRNYDGNIKDGKLVVSKKSNYDASEEIKKALGLLNSGKKAEIITNINSSSNIVSLSFEGLSDRDTMNKIIAMLDEQGIKATFFIPGIKAAEDPSLVKTIQKHGHDIGSGTLSWSKNMEKLPTIQLVDDFSRTNKILKTITGKDPVLLKCNSTVYQDNILTAAYASGNSYVVGSNHYLSYQSFKNYDEAYSYTSNLDKGTVISIKLEGVLDSTEYEKRTAEEKPAVDKQPGIDQGKDKGKEEVHIIQTVQWLLKAIGEQNRTVVKAAELPGIGKQDKLERDKYKFGSDYYVNNISNRKGLLKDSNILGDKNKELESKEESEKVTNTDFINFKELLEKNNKKQAPVVSKFYTTQEALAYTFRGLSNEGSLEEALSALDRVNAKGTFFVTKDEVLKYPDRIDKILSKGHEIGNGGITTSVTLLSKSTEEICKEIYEVDKLLKEKGIATKAYMAGYGYINSQIQEALSAVTNIPSLKNYELFTYSKAPIVNKYKGISAKDIVENYFNIEHYPSLQKGEIVYFRLDSNLFETDDIVADMIKIVTENYVQKGYINRFDGKSKDYERAQKPLGYSIVALNNLQNTMESSSQFGRYTIRGNFEPLRKRSYEESLSMIKTNYIGNQYIDFDKEDNIIIDKSGTIDTRGESVIFFTFDDWGGDPAIDGILDVLNKHKVKGSFFVIPKYTDIDNDVSNANPNLLRTIALNGNDIGSHNYNHELLEADKQELEKSLVKSYEAMGKVVGDLDSLRPYFRPPTLLSTKEGLSAVFESGYKYSISGNITTHDYERTSAQDIVNYIEKGLIKNKGNIVVMHMNDQSYYTAEALDLFLTNNEKGLYGEKYKIAKLSDYLER